MKNRKIVELPKETIKKNLGKCLKSEKKGNSKGITLVSLIITIIVLIILAGISINLTIGDEGIFTIAKRAKENMELAQIEEQEKLNTLYTEFDFNTEGEKEIGDIVDAIDKLGAFKEAIAIAIKQAGGIPIEKPKVADTETFQERIKGIVAEVTKNATATPEDITEGKTAWVNGQEITGTNQSSNSFTVINKFPYVFEKDCNAVICEHYYGINTTDYGHKAAYISITIKLDSEILITEKDTPTGEMDSGSSSNYKVFQAKAGQTLTVSCQSSIVKKGNAAFLVILN